MTYTSPSLAEVLANEQTLNTNLISLRKELREALDTLGIEYESSDTVLDLISRLMNMRSIRVLYHRLNHCGGGCALPATLITLPWWSLGRGATLT